MSESVLVWEEFLGSERAQIGVLEFFVCKTAHGAELYPDSGSFDQGYGSTSHVSVESAKVAAEEIARHTFDALVAPVLRWTQGEPGESCADVSGWSLTAATSNWALIHTSGAKLLSPRPNNASEQENRRAAEAALRSLGVVFRTEGE